MTEKEKHIIWNERANGMRTDELAKRHRITEKELFAILEEAGWQYRNRYNHSGRISETAYDGFMPKKQHDE